jgi:hypothetical protein
MQWPTLLTLVMFPILMTMYVRLARREERELQADFGEAYARYAAKTPAFFPHLRHSPVEWIRRGRKHTATRRKQMDTFPTVELLFNISKRA